MSREAREDALLLATLIFASFAIAALFVSVLVKANRGRAPISNDATYAQVVANFTGRPYSTGSFVSGYRCAGYTAGKDGHGWVVIRCQK